MFRPAAVCAVNLRRFSGLPLCGLPDASGLLAADPVVVFVFLFEFPAADVLAVFLRLLVVFADSA